MQFTRPGMYFGYWIVLGAFVAQVVSVGTNTMAGAFLKPMTEDLGWTRSDYTYAITVSRFLLAFIGFFIGVYVDRWGSRPLMLVGITVTVVSLALTASVTETWQWMALRGVVLALGTALIGNLVVNVTMSRWWVEKRAQMIGLSSMGVSVAGVVFPPLVTFVIDGWGWRIAWLIVALIAAVTCYPAALLMRRQPEDYGLHPDGRSQSEVQAGGGTVAAADFANSFTRREALHTTTFYLVVAAFGLSQVGAGALQLQTIPFLTDQEYSGEFAALMFSTMAFFALICKPFWGWVAGHTEPGRAAAVGFVQSAIAMVLILVAAQAHSVAALAIGFALMGWGSGGAIPLQETIWASYFGRRYIGAVRSAALPVTLLVGAGAPLAVSAYYDVVGNYAGIFFTIAGLWTLAALIAVLIRRPTRPQPIV